MNPPIDAPRAANRTVLVTGATGMVGRALVRSFSESGVHVLALSRNTRRARQLLGEETVRCIDSLDEVPCDLAMDAIVHLAGARVLDRRWTVARRDTLLRSRTDISEEISRLIIDVDKVRGALNAVAPETPEQSDFIRAIAARFGAASASAFQRAHLG